MLMGLKPVPVKVFKFDLIFTFLIVPHMASWQGKIFVDLHLCKDASQLSFKHEGEQLIKNFKISWYIISAATLWQTVDFPNDADSQK